jgi:predicted ATPase
MIKRIYIENYKSLRRVTVPLQEMTVVFGPNAAGKSNLFDALNLLARLVTCKNIKEAFEGHRGLPLESVHYHEGDLAEVLAKESHNFTFEADVLLSDAVIRDVEQRITDLRKGLDKEKELNGDRTKVTERFLRYRLELEILTKTGVVRVKNERLCALSLRTNEEKARNAFLEKMEGNLSLRMEGQAHPSYHEVGLDYTIASTPRYAPHYPHLTAFREEMSRCRFYYFEPRELMRAANAVADVTALGSRGEDLAAFFHTLKDRNPAQFDVIKLAAQQLVPSLTDISIERNSKAELFLNVTVGKATYSNRLISEGTLRVLGLLAILSPLSGSTTIGYEEPENGVHPRRLRDIAEILINASNSDRQILVNTHSPILPEYFKNENLLVCKMDADGTMFVPLTEIMPGDLYRKTEIAAHLEERIIRGDYGG